MSCLERGLELTAYVGKGSFADSVYYKANHASGCTVAIKVIPSEPSQESYDKISNELGILSQSQSPFIIGFVEWFVHPKSIEMWIVEEHCEAGRLVDLLDDNGLPEACIRAVCASVVLALEHLHYVLHVCHRDVRCSHILLTRDGHVKLTGFALASKLSNNNRAPALDDALSNGAYWKAPEVIRESHSCPCSDIWSLGITTIEMAQGVPPHSSLSPLRAFDAIEENSPPTLANTGHWSTEMLDFIRCCCQKESKLRRDSVVLSTHPFVKSDVVALHILQLFAQQKEGTSSDGYSKLLAPHNPGLPPIRRLLETKHDKLESIQRERQEEYAAVLLEEASKVQRKQEFVRDYLLDATKSPEEQKFMHDLEADPNRSFSKFAAVSYDEDEFDAPTPHCPADDDDGLGKDTNKPNDDVISRFETERRRHVRRRSSLDEAAQSLSEVSDRDK